MENGIWADILLAATVAVVFALGFFIMKRLDKFLNKNFRYDHSDEELTRKEQVQNKSAENTSDENESAENASDE